MRKGNLVKLNADKCFTSEQGGGRRYPLSNHHNDENGVVQAGRPVTQEETSSWYNSDASKGMTSAGETKLPPQSYGVRLYRDRVYTVLRARCRVRLGWGNPIPGMAHLLCTVTGENAYIKREFLEVVA